MRAAGETWTDALRTLSPQLTNWCLMSKKTQWAASSSVWAAMSLTMAILLLQMKRAYGHLTTSQHNGRSSTRIWVVVCLHFDRLLLLFVSSCPFQIPRLSIYYLFTFGFSWLEVIVIEGKNSHVRQLNVFITYLLYVCVCVGGGFCVSIAVSMLNQ